MNPSTQTKIEEFTKQVEQLRRVGRYQMAIPLAGEAGQLLRQTVGEKDPRFIKATASLADLYQATEDYDQARALYQWALQLKRKETNPDPADTAALLNSLGELFQTTGRFKLAEQHLNEALTIQQRLYPGEHPDLAQTLHSLGRLHLSRGDYVGAETQFDRALKMRQATLPEKDPALAQSLHDQARLHHAWGITTGPKRSTGTPSGNGWTFGAKYTPKSASRCETRPGSFTTWANMMRPNGSTIRH